MTISMRRSLRVLWAAAPLDPAVDPFGAARARTTPPPRTIDRARASRLLTLTAVTRRQLHTRDRAAFARVKAQEYKANEREI